MYVGKCTEKHIDFDSFVQRWTSLVTFCFVSPVEMHARTNLQNIPETKQNFKKTKQKQKASTSCGNSG